jgi:hypothetical protein
MLTGVKGMDSKRTQVLLTGVVAWISLLLMITTTYGGSIVIGGDYTDIGTIVVISPKPGDPTGNGTALLNNLAGISADATHPYVIKLGPGIYDIGTNSLQMKQYVDIEGSGENTTKITGKVESSQQISTGTVNGANNAEIRFLTVENTATSGEAIAFYNNLVSPAMTHVTINAVSNFYAVGVSNISASPSMMNVAVTLSGSNCFGVQNTGNSSATMKNVTVTASCTTLVNAIVNSSSSPTMKDVVVAISGQNNLYGVTNYLSSPMMKNITISASGVDTINGVSNDDSFPTMIDVAIMVAGRNQVVGVYNYFSNVTAYGPMAMTNIISSASGTSQVYGMWNISNLSGPHGVAIDRSTFSGTTNSIFNDPAFTLNIGASKLIGLPNTAGTYICVSSYDGTSYSSLNTSCGCNAGLTTCAGSCVNLNTDHNNCGACGHVCGSTQTCINSVCN